MPTAEIITIGTELLLGETQDTNTRYIANVLRNAGIDLYRTTTIGDNGERITEVIREAIQRSHIILTTGGLGPTVDDPTRTAIANALGVNTEFQPELWEQIQNRFSKYGRIPTENNRRQAYIPHGALAVENHVGTAPAFIAETGNGVLIALPGVPPEMEYLLEYAIMPYLKNRFHLEGIIKAFVIHTAGLGESQIDEKLEDLEILSNPTVGLAAYPGQVDIRVTAKATSSQVADKMIKEVVEIIENRLSSVIFGYNETTLAQVVSNQLRQKNIKITIIESGTVDALSNELKFFEVLEQKSFSVDESVVVEELEKLVKKLYKEVSPNPVLGIKLEQNTEKSTLHLLFKDHNAFYNKTFSFGGHEKLTQLWAVNNALNIIRILINQ